MTQKTGKARRGDEIIRGKSVVKSIVMKKHTVVTPGLIECVISDCFGAQMSQRAVAEKYGLSSITVFRWCQKNKHRKSLYEPFKPAPIIKRQELSDAERLKFINGDSMSVVEKVLAVVNHRLDQELATYESGTVVEHGLKMNELAVLISEITPYLIEKKVAKPSNAKATPASKKGNVFEMFKQQQQQPKAK